MNGKTRAFWPVLRAPGRPRPAKLRSSIRSIGRRTAVATICATLTGFTVVASPTPSAAVTDEDPEFFVNRADLEFILKQIKISESHAAGGKLLCDDRADQSWTCVPDARLPYGLRTVDGTLNNLMPNRSTYGAAGQVFPRLLPPEFKDADGAPFDPDGPGPVKQGDRTSYKQKTGLVFDAGPRTVSNLIVDQTAANPAAVDAAKNTPGSTRQDHDDDPATPDRIDIPNVSPDEGLSAPFNSWFTLFGQFFDHGLDLVSKGGSGTVMVPLQPDDPLYDPASGTNFLVLTRATNKAGPDGILGNADDVQEHTNRTTPFIDQNQTYTSHPSHQVFVREYRAGENGPVPTGRLLDGQNGGLATWADVKKQARELLGIALDDMDALNVPLVATDPYGHFLPGDNGLPQLVRPGSPNTLVEGDTEAPVDATGGIRVNHAFLDDIAHDAVPNTAGTYDAVLLDKHFITGDGRGNENIGLSAVHQVFHAEHNRLADHIDEVIKGEDDAFVDAWADESGPWNYGERLFQAARFVTEMQYQHLVFEEFARKLVPSIDVVPFNESTYHADINPAVTAEFAHVVYRFGHSMLTDTVARDGWGTEDLPLLDAFLNPDALTDGGRITPEQGAGAVIQGMVNQTGNGIDEFVVDTLRNNLLGLPLDLATINMARARDTGIPSLQTARRIFYSEDLNPAVKPYDSWEDFRLSMKHRGSIVNFVAAYGVDPTLAAAGTVAEKRAAAQALVERPAFMNAPAKETGLNNVDFWVGGLAERSMDFGGMLGSTFNVVFEEHLENLQHADRFYYLTRLQGLNLIAQMEANSFSELIMRNTDAGILPADSFATQSPIIQIAELPDNQSAWPNGLQLTSDGTYRYDGEDHVTIHGTDGDDRMRGGDGDDALWGHEGRDVVEGDVGADTLHGGQGDDVLTDLFGDDVIHGGAGNDAINSGPGLDLIFGQNGRDFVQHGQEPTQSFAGAGSDFIRGGRAADTITGNEEDDWLEGGIGADLVQGDNALTFQNDPNGGADVLNGGSGNDDHDAEGGDDILYNNGTDRHAGMLGFDWVTHKSDPDPVDADLGVTIFQPPNVTLMRSRFFNVEGLSGWSGPDVLRGKSTAGDRANPDGSGHELSQKQLDHVVGLRNLLGGGDQPVYAAPFTETNDANDIILGGADSDLIEGRAGDDFVDGDAWLDVYLKEAGGTKHASMSTLQAKVFAGQLSPADVQLVREIKVPAAQGEVVDTVQFSGPRAEYEITENADEVVEVAHVGGAATDGRDTLKNVERLLFSDRQVNLTELFNRAARGTVTVSDVTPAEDQELTAVGDFTDANGIQEDTVAYAWQIQQADGSWVSATRTGQAFTPGDAEVGRRLRAVVTFTDDLGTLETLTSEPTGEVENVNDVPQGLVLSTMSPQIGSSVEATGLTDEDGLPEQVHYQWQRSWGTRFTDVAGATDATYVVPQSQGGRQLRVVVTYTDAHGTAERVESPVTDTVPVWTVPGAPAIGTATPGEGSVTVTWEPPTDTGGTALAGYLLQVWTDGVLQRTITGIDPESTSTVVDGLAAGVHRFRVRAVNAVGLSPYSAFVSTTLRPSDTTGPTITGRVPGVDAVGVSRTANVAVTFSEPVVGVSDQTFTLRRASDGTEVPGVLTMTSATRAVLDPVGSLAGDEVYEVVVTGGVTDVAGNALARTAWRFTTVDTVRPVVTDEDPAPGATGVDRNANVTARFDEAVTGVSGSTMTLNLGLTAVPVTVTYDADTRTAVMDPNVVLAANRRYTAKLTSGIKDARGNTLPATTWQFTTGTTITPAAQ